MLTVVSLTQQLFGLVTQRHLFLVGERAHCETRPNNDCGKDFAYFRCSKKEKTKPRNFTTKSKLKLLYLQLTLTKDRLRSQVSEDILKERKG